MENFNVIVEGKILPGFEMAQVSNDLAKLINQSEEFAKKLLRGNETTIKSGVDSKTGEVYLAALRRIGVACFVAPQKLEIDIGLTQVTQNINLSSELPIQQKVVPAPTNAGFGVHIRTRNNGPEKAIDRSALSTKWQTRFALIDKAGGASLPNVRALSFFERWRMSRNFPALFFGPFYYFAKGMWLRGLTLIFFGVAIFSWVFILLKLFLPQYLSHATPVLFSAWVLFYAYANIDYYKAFNELGVKRWTGFWIGLIVVVIAIGASSVVMEDEPIQDFSKRINQENVAKENIWDYLRSVISAFGQRDVNASARQVLDQIYGPYNNKLECWLDKDAYGQHYCMKIDRIDKISTAMGKRIYILAAGDTVDENGEPNGAHVQSGQVGAFVVEEQKDRLAVVSSNPRIAVGASGYAPTKWKLVKLGPVDYWGWGNSSGDGHAGFYGSRSVMLAPYVNDIRDVASFTTSYSHEKGDPFPDDTEGNSSADAQFNWDYSQTNVRVYPLLITLTGTLKGRVLTPKTWRVPFDFKKWEYPEPKDWPLKDVEY